MTEINYPVSCERWDLFEVSCLGFSGTEAPNKNPFVDYTVQGVFKHKNETLKVNGFYDGNGIYKTRFMPSFAGEYSFEISGSFSEKSRIYSCQSI